MNPQGLESGEQTGNAFDEIGFRGDQAHNKIAVGGEVIEVAGMDVEIFCVEKVDSEIFVGARCRDAQDGVPAAFEMEAAAGLLRGQLTIQSGEIFANAGLPLVLERFALLQK